MLFEKFCANVLNNNMISAGGGVVAGISGGADSVCLLTLLLQLRDKYGIKIYCAHINHGIRETALRDEEFVKRLCEKNNVDFFVKRLNIVQMAKDKGISEELCGREERYSFFFELLKKTESNAIFTAHNKNDNAETMLLHLIRGSGTKGMSGISFCRGDGVFRPMADFSRCEIEEYLKEKNIKWVSDETNDTDLYTRNFIRHNILPQMEKINPSVCDALWRSSALFAQDDEYLTAAAENEKAVKVSAQGIVIDTVKIKKAPVPIAKRIIISACRAADGELTNSDIEAVYALSAAQTGKKHIFPSGLEAVRGYDSILLVRPGKTEDYFYPLEINQEVYIKETNMYVSLTREKPKGKSVGLIENAQGYGVRKRCNGDRFVPFGMTGSKKLKDFFVDLKIPSYERDAIPVVISGEKIACVGNIRPDAAFAASDSEKTLYFSCRKA